MSVTDYTLRIKDLCNSGGSTNVAVDDDEMVQQAKNPRLTKKLLKIPGEFKAMRGELRTLFDNDTWDLVPSSEIKQKPIGYR